MMGSNELGVPGLRARGTPRKHTASKNNNKQTATTRNGSIASVDRLRAVTSVVARLGTVVNCTFLLSTVSDIFTNQQLQLVPIREQLTEWPDWLIQLKAGFVSEISLFTVKNSKNPSDFTTKEPFWLMRKKKKADPHMRREVGIRT